MQLLYWYWCTVVRVFMLFSLQQVTVNIVGDRDGFIWKGHSCLILKTTVHKPDKGFQPQMAVQVMPPAAFTSLSVQSDWHLYVFEGNLSQFLMTICLQIWGRNSSWIHSDWLPAEEDHKCQMYAGRHGRRQRNWCYDDEKKVVQKIIERIFQKDPTWKVHGRSQKNRCRRRQVS